MTTNDKKLVLLVGILAAGIFAATFASAQLLSANAQTTNNQTGSQPVVTSADDVNCAEDVSAVHCVDGNTTIATSHDSVSSTVSTSGTATTKVQPDKFTVTVGVETNGTTAQEAASANADQVTKVIAALKALGISEDDISTSSYSVYPAYSYKDPANACRVMEGYPVPPDCYVDRVNGYKASSSQSVTLDADGDIEAGGVIDAAINAGANTVQGAYFFLSQERQQEVQDGLIGEAISNARHRADIAADAVDMQVSGVKAISLSDIYFPIFAKDVSLQAGGGTQILPGQQDVTMTVSLVYYLSDGNAGSSAEENNSGSSDAITIARNFILSKLPGLGIQIDNELDLHTDMVVQVSETEFRLDYSVVDTNDQVHDGYIEVVDGVVTVANLDGESIL